jgi:hypothetical protein
LPELTRVVLALGDNATHTGFGPIEDWINIEIIQKLAHHTSAVVAAVAMFALVGFIVTRLLRDSLLKRAVLIFDEIVLLGLLVYLAYDLFVSLIGF